MNSRIPEAEPAVSAPVIQYEENARARILAAAPGEITPLGNAGVIPEAWRKPVQ